MNEGSKNDVAKSLNDFQAQILQHWKLYLEDLSDSDSDSELGNMSKRTNRNFLYRGQEFDTEGVHKPLKLPSSTPDFNMTIAEHITNYTTSSPYLSLSKDLNVATLYAMCYSKGKKSKIFVVNKACFEPKNLFDMRKQLTEFLQPYIKRGKNVPIEAIKLSMRDHEVLALPDRKQLEIPVTTTYEVEHITEKEAETLEKMIKEGKSDSLIFWRKYVYRQDTWSKFVDGIEVKSKKKLVKYFKYRPIMTVTPPQWPFETSGKTIYSHLLNDNFDDLELDEEEISGGAWTLLHYAAYFDAVKVITRLVKLDPKIIDDVTKEEGWTPLMICSITNSVKAMKVLLELKADKSLKDLRGQTALDLAKDYESLDCLKLLSQ